ncbi:MAG: universal stress protein, partial [Thermoanaerobaculia bacterium]|nr:universal stress protein [Thermoanaerobaculia bacterium]
MNVKKILMPTDFSDCAQAALGHALFLAEQLEAELHLLHVIVVHQDDPFNPAYHFPDADEIYEQLQAAAAAGMKQLIEAHKDRRLDIVEAHRRGVAAAPEIVAYVQDQGIDLVVLGAH